MKFIKKFLIPIILFVISIILIIPYLEKGFIVASGESSIPINPSYINPFYIWDERSNFGGYFASQSVIVLFFLFWNVFKLFSQIINPSIIFLFLSFFLPGFFMYFLLKNILKFDNKLIYLPACLLYSFNIFRIQAGYQNENISLFFIFLPIFFLTFYNFLQNPKLKYVTIIVALSFLSSTMGNNLGVFILPYFVLLLLLIFSIFKEVPKIKKIIILSGLMIFFVVLINLFWMIPLAQILIDSFNLTGGGTTIFAVTGSGSFFDHFRFMGFWAWRSGYGYSDYFPFYPGYDKLFLIITTFFISIFSFVFLLSVKEKKDYFLKSFTAFLMAFSLFLVIGTKGSVGFIYQFLYDNIPLFKVFREPYTKFMPLFIFSSCIGLTFSIDYLMRKINKGKLLKNIFILTVSIIILINVYPLFSKEAMPIRRWNMGQIGSVLKIPAYWQETKFYLEKSKLDTQIFLLPYNFYSTLHNLEYGINVVGNLADYLIQKKFIRGWDVDTSNGGQIINLVFEESQKKINWQKYFGFLGSRSILVENDVEWRYSSRKILSPSQTKTLLSKQRFSKVAEFGKFTTEYLSDILNNDPQESVHNEFYKELTNNPALVLYKSENKYYLPHFYTPKNNILSKRNINELPRIFSQNNLEIRSAVFFEKQNIDKADTLESLKVNNKNKLPIIEFKKINPTKYQVRVHSADGEFPLVFSESFHDGWKAYLTSSNNFKLPILNFKSNPNDQISNYKILDGNEEDQANKTELAEFIEKGWISDLGNLQEREIKHQKWDAGKQKEELDYVEKFKIDFISKNFQDTIQNDNLPKGKIWETWFKKPMSEETHLMVNGYANSWIINADEICKDNISCVKNEDGSYDFEIVVEFWPQRLLYVGLGISLVTLLACIAYLLYNLKYEKTNENLEINKG